MKLKELFSDLNVLFWNADPELEVSSVSSDSRKIQKGAAFVCLKGLKVDGRVWIPQSFEKGAVVAICQEKPEGDVPFVLVEDTRAALPLLLSNFYEHPEKSFRRIIGITGTNGKTTTSFMMKAIFDRAGCKTGLIGTTKYLVCDEEFRLDAGEALLTTPDPELLFRLFAAMREKGVDTVIMEASSHALALKKLTGVPFDLGVFTNLTQDHIDFHKTMEDYLEAKKGLFRVAKKGIFNCDDPAFDRLSENVPANVVTYSAKGTADYTSVQVLSHDDKGITYSLRCGEEEREIFVSIPGSFTVY
ncbi:MAG: UDP-N-acetylmuramoyl-L-alanyl-D-glutamate--2,6-diaminopimelate ligase, partial [Clostridia bacterium]|nr:UDP-N-acetylmuramoyl-L-alanyl-D-glutamate--2,6-diaminopimelate ligase [Clostridia bacterium]